MGEGTPVQQRAAPLLILRSRLALLGLTMVVLAAGFHLPMLLLGASHGNANPYMDMYFFVALPGLTIAGVALILIGRRRAQIREQAGKAPPSWSSRMASTLVGNLVLIGAGTPLFLAAGYSGFTTFHYSESVGDGQKRV